jgi:hypothetical protein
MANESRPKWTAIFLFKGLGETVAAMDKIIAQLLKIRKGDGLSIIICINIKAELLESDLLTVDYPRERNATQEGWTTLFYSVTTIGSGSSTLALIREKEDFDLRKQEDVSYFFKQEVLGAYTSEEYMLFTWDHGQPFGVFFGSRNRTRYY